MQFDMNRTWAQAVAKVRGNFQLLALIAGVFMLVPGLVAIIAMPQVFSFAGQDAGPEAAEERLQAILPSFFGTMSVVLLISLIGYAAMVALVGRDRPTVGAALARALKAMPSLVGAMIAFAAIYLVLAMIAGVIGGVVAAATGMTGSTAGSYLLVWAGLLFAMLYCASRMALLLPVIVLDGVRNPLSAIAISLRRTRKMQWRILAFFALLSVAYLAIVLVVSLILSAIGMVAGGGGLLFGIVTGLIGMVAAMLISAILVSMHDQLTAGAGPANGEPV